MREEVRRNSKTLFERVNETFDYATKEIVEISNEDETRSSEKDTQVRLTANSFSASEFYQQLKALEEGRYRLASESELQQISKKKASYVSSEIKEALNAATHLNPASDDVSRKTFSVIKEMTPAAREALCRRFRGECATTPEEIVKEMPRKERDLLRKQFQEELGKIYVNRYKNN